MSLPVALVRFLPDGELELFAFADEGGAELRMLVVDERCPSDRVYEIVERVPLAGLSALVKPGEPIGSRDDARHAALLAMVEAAREGRTHLEIVR
jgi:hypothetical protein